MKNRKLIIAALMTAFAFPIASVIADSTPVGTTVGEETLPGPRPERPRLSPEQREKLRAMTPEERQKFHQERRAECMRVATTETPCPQKPRQPRLSQEQRDKVKAMTPEQRQEFFREMRENRMRMGPGAGAPR